MSHRFSNLVIRASAGTGKTFQLSNRFIGLAAAGEPLDAILASTFTRKAAGEILDRVLTRLAGAALDAAKLAELNQHVQGEPITRDACLRLVAGMVRRLHRLRVGTLDSFFVQIAQSFGLELGLPPGWQIVDEIDDAAMRAEAVRRVVARESTGDASELMHLLHKGQASRSVAEEISMLVKDLYGAYVDAPAAAWQTVPRRKPLAPAELQAAIDAAAAVNLGADKRMISARDGDLDRAGVEDWDAFVAKGLAAKILADEPEYYRKPIPDDLLAAYRPLVEQAKAAILGRLANQTEGTYRLLDRFDAVYRRLKIARQAIRFDDVTRMLAGADLAGRLDEVVYRLDAPVAHLLLDEFQDTSPQQWRVLRPFARESVRADARRSFFCVGDVKQAIYGWRGGVAEIFDTLDNELTDLAREELTRSFRSAPAVIDVVNRVFQGIGANPALAKHPEAAQAWARRFTEHSTAREKLPGHCRMVAAPRAPEGQPQANVTLDHAASLVKRLHEESPACSIG
ncbi:MAG: UvrD-helicase domain-containing protein, partial [Patescibacteria group bacterium]|nr:UvrD-helicase domain-containing protein [Patescibacteria group bacterium]